MGSILRNHKGQAATEFLIFVWLVVIISLIALFVIYGDYRDRIYRIEESAVRDFGRALQREVFLASEVTDGYERTVILPSLINNQLNYDITHYPFSIVINTSRLGEYPFPIPNITGGFTKGTNTIRKQNGTVSIS